MYFRLFRDYVGEVFKDLIHQFVVEINSIGFAKEKIFTRRCEDLLEIARLVSWCTDREYLIKTRLDHVNQRLGMRARCVLKVGEDLKLNCWVGRYDYPIEQVPIM